MNLFALSLFLFGCISQTNGFNLVVDTHPRIVDRIFGPIQDELLRKLNSRKLPHLEKKRRFGVIELDDVTLENVDAERIFLSFDSDEKQYHVHIVHLHSSISGSFHNSILKLMHQKGKFDLSIRDLKAKLGPFNLRNMNGLPYVDDVVQCSIQHEEDKVHLHDKNLFNMLIRYRLQETMRKDLENLLCDEFITITDEFMRSRLHFLKLKRKLLTGAVMDYSLEFDPMLMNHGTIRTFHHGIAHNSTDRVTFTNPLRTQESDIIFYIHQNLFSETLSSLCHNKLFNKYFPIYDSHAGLALNLTCIGNTVVSLERYPETNRGLISLPLTYSIWENGELKMEVEKRKNLTVNIVHNERTWSIRFQVMSEIVDNGEPERFYFGRQVLAHLSEQIREWFVLPLPAVQGVQFNNLRATLNPDRIVLGVDVSKETIALRQPSIEVL